MQTEHDPLPSEGTHEAEDTPVLEPEAQIAQLTAERDDMRWKLDEALTTIGEMQEDVSADDDITS